MLVLMRVGVAIGSSSLCEGAKNIILDATNSFVKIYYTVLKHAKAVTETSLHLSITFLKLAIQMRC